MKKLIFFVLVCGVMYSCTNIWPFSGDYHHAIPQDKIPLLNNNDMVYFQDSASSKVDTFRLVVLDSWRQIESDNFQEINIYYKKPSQKESFLDFRITTANVGGVTFFIYFDYMESYGYQKEISNLSLHGVTYQNLYILQNVTPDTIPNKLFYTYKNGIIRYEYKDGRVYNLLSK
jgi:hypothetical protein